MSTITEIAKRYQERKNSEKDSVTYTDVRDRYKAYKIKKSYENGTLNDDIDPLIDRINSYRYNYNKYISDYNDRFVKSDSDGEEATDEYFYRTGDDAAQWAKSATDRKAQLDGESSAILSELEFYKPYVSEEWYNGIANYFNGHGDTMGSIVDVATKDNAYWSKWENEEAYKEDYYNYLASNQYAYIDSFDKAEQALNEFNGIDINSLSQQDSARYRYVQRLYNYYEIVDYDKDGAIQMELDKEYYNNSYDILEQGGDTDNMEAFDAAKVHRDEYEDWKKRNAEHTRKKDLKKYVLRNEAQYDIYEAYRQSADFAQNSVYLSGEDELYEYINGNEDVIRQTDSSFEEVVKNMFGVGQSYLKTMTNEEKAMYNYLYYLDQNDGGNRVNEYMDFIFTSLKDRRANELFETYFKDRTFLELYASAGIGLNQFASGIFGIFQNEYTPSDISLVGGKIREDLADDSIPFWYNAKTGRWEDKAFGASVAQMIYDAGTTTANMLPSILVSAAVEAALPTVGEGAAVFAGLTAAQIAAGAGAVTLGASAMGNAKQEMLGMGYSVEQATAYGLMVGASEAGLSYLLSGIPGLRGSDGVFSALGEKVIGKVDNALARAAIALGGNMLDEGLEEGLQTVLESWFKGIVTADFEDPSIDEILYSSLLGMLTAAGFGGGKLAINTGISGLSNIANNYSTVKSFIKQNGQGGVGALAAQGLGMNWNTAAYKQAAKVQSKIDGGKKVRSYSVGKLYTSMSESQTSTALQTRLSANIENKTEVRKLSDTITDILYGREVSGKNISAVAANKYALNALNDVLGSKLGKDATVSDVKAAVKSYQEASKGESGANASTNTKQGSAAKISGRGDVQFTVEKNADGGYDVVGTKGSDKAVLGSFKSQKQAQAAAYAMTLGMGVEGYRGLVAISESLADGVDLGEAALAFNAFYNQGKNGKAFSAAKNMELLSPEQRQYAYNLGIMDKALDSARAKKEGGSPPASDVQYSSS